jgi:hypothetical protein
MLELNRLTGQVAEMAEALAGQRRNQRERTESAREHLSAYAQVTDELREKIVIARRADESWRGADPLGDRLDQCVQAPQQVEPATLVATDGSQIYPDTHAIALYYLTNVGSIVLRQGSGAAPATSTAPILRLAADDPLEEQDHDRVDADEVNLRRDLRELETLAALARSEREALGGDMERLVVALADGPLLPWLPQRMLDVEQRQRVRQFTAPLDDLKASYAAPLGYVDRPRSANVLRLLYLAQLPAEAISKGRLRQRNEYDGLSDAALFQDLLPGQRTGLFAATSEINENFAAAGQRICFCYMNVATEAGESNAAMARVEMPEWIARDPDRLEAALAAVWSDCRLLRYPYLLTRAHELALVTRQERATLEQMLRTEMMRLGMRFEESPKANTKRFVGGR